MPRKCDSALLGSHAWSRHPGLVGSDVLSVAAFQLGNPVTLIILPKTNDPALHGNY
jgi:hypothetical protein